MTFQYEIDGETYSRPGRFGVECRRVDGSNDNVYFDDRPTAQIEFDRVKQSAGVEFLMFFDYGALDAIDWISKGEGELQRAG